MLDKRSWHVFNVGSEYFIYNTLCKQAIKISKDIFSELMKNNPFTISYIEEYFSKYQNLPSKPLTRNDYDLFLLVSNTCNAHCVYCFASQGNYGKVEGIMSSDIAYRTIDAFMEKVPAQSNIRITFFGGEPLLAKEVIFDSILYIQKKYNWRNVKYSITTNGYTLDHETIDFFKSNHVTVALSMDGNHRIQCCQRPLNNRKDSFLEITKNLSYMKENKVPLLARGTYFDFHYDLSKIYIDLLILGFDEIQIVPDLFHIQSNDDILLLEKQLDKFNNFVIYYIRNLMYDAEKFPFTSLIISLRSLYLSPYDYTYTCEKGKTLFAVDYVGDIYPCHRLSSDSSKKIANVFQTNPFETSHFNTIEPDFSKQHCKFCWNRFTCSHGCEFNKENLTKLAFCAYSKKLTEGSIAVASALDSETIRKIIRI